MKEDRKKEIEAKFLKLIAESEKPEKSKTPTLMTTSRAKVIRRRKGRPDQHIA